MSKNHESRSYAKKKFYQNSRSEGGSSSGKYNYNSRNRVDSESFTSKQPTILIKPREKQNEDVPEPPKKIIMQNEAHSSQTSAITLTIAESKPQATSAPKIMTKSVKFLEDGVICSEALQDFLTDNSDFLVIGIIGAQGTGKSTILNLLAHPNITDQLKQKIFKYSSTNQKKSDDPFSGDTNLTEQLQIDDRKTKRRPNLFKIENVDDIEANRNCTTGIDMYISENRVIFLDCQPLLSVTMLDELLKSDAKRSSIVTDFLYTENSAEIQSLQFMSLFMAICHVMMFVQDCFYDTNMIRFLKTAEMLKPTISNQDDDFPEHFPHLILVHNKAEMEYFQPAMFKIVQQMYRLMFNDTRLHIESGLGIANGNVLINLCKETCGEPINLFLLPIFENSDKYYNGHPPFEDIIKAFRSSLLGATKYSLTHIQLTEKNWLIYTAKVWDLIKKSSFFVDYAKLMT